MEIYSNGYRYINWDKWNVCSLPKKYDYVKNGIMKQLLSKNIVNSKNTALQALLKYMDTSFTMVMKYIERLQNFKNYAYKNR